MSEDPKVIVVIGSVTSKEYDSVRLARLHNGINTKIVRLPNDDISHLSGTVPLQGCDETAVLESMQTIMDLFCQRYDFTREAVIDVVVRQDDWEDQGNPRHHAFHHHYWDAWPNLSHVSVVGADGQIEAA